MAGTKKGAAKKPTKGARAPEVEIEAPPVAASEAAAPVAATEDYDPSQARVALKKVRDAWGPCDPSDRRAFAAALDDDARAELGRRTKSNNVLSGAARYASLVSQTFEEHEAIVAEHYDPRRFRYLLDAAIALGALIAKEEAKAALPTPRADVATREAAAREARTKLVKKLRAFADGRRAYAAALAQALGDTQSIDDLGRSMKALVTLGRAWRALGDETSAVLRETSKLTDAVIAAAAEAAAALTATAADATNAPAIAFRDSPALNLQEGTVLHELRVARRAFQDAHEETTLIPKLPVPHGLEAVLGTRPTTGASDTPPGQANTPPGQANTPPGQANTPPGQANTSPGEANTRPGEANTSPAEVNT